MFFFRLSIFLCFISSALAQGRGALSLQARVPASTWSYQSGTTLFGGNNENSNQKLYFEADPGSVVTVNGQTYQLDEPLQLNLHHWQINRPADHQNLNRPLHLSVVEP